MRTAAFLGTFLVSAPLWCYSLMAGKAYVNVDYGVEVKVPPGFAASCDDPPRPNHGFQLEASGLGSARVWFDASYDARELNSLEAVAMDYAKTYGHGAVVTSSLTRLGSLPARRLRLTKAGKTEEVVLAFRAQPDGTGIIYTIGLTCSPADCKLAREAVERLRTTVGLRPIH